MLPEHNSVPIAGVTTNAAGISWRQALRAGLPISSCAMASLRVEGSTESRSTRTVELGFFQRTPYRDDLA